MTTYTKSIVNRGICDGQDGEVIKLVRHEIFTINQRSGERSLKAIKGTFWVTQANDLQDYLLQPGESLQINKRGKVAIEALSEACLEIN
jgi:hypothetical protein